jgi:hypothetical protein
MVALPHTEFPLNIFEARYRVLFNTILAGADECAPPARRACMHTGLLAAAPQPLRLHIQCYL